MPEIITIQQQPLRTFIVTQSDWTANLVSSCVAWSTFEYTTLQALSDCQLLFENYSSINTERKTLHLLQLDARAWFSTANILRPTMKLRQQLESALSLWPKDKNRAWVAIQRVWSDFGYFWPRKIQLGHRLHVPWPFEVPHDLPDKLYPLRLAKDEATTRIEYTINSGYQDINDEHTASQPQRWTIIKRNDLEPIHNFLPAFLRDRIVDIVQFKANRILVNRPFQLHNCYTEGYLSWRLVQQRITDPPVVRFASIPNEMVSNGKHNTLWKFVWSADHSRMASPTLDMNNIKKITDKHSIKSGSQVYLQPALMNTTSNAQYLPMNRLILSRILTDMQPSVIGGVEFLDALAPMDIPIAEGEEDPRRWTLELPGLDLASTDEDLNIDIKLLKMKPIQNNELLALRQVLYLCSEPNGADVPIVGANGLTVRRNSQKARKSGPWKTGSPNSDLCSVMVKEWDMVKNQLELTWMILPVQEEKVTIVPKASTVPRVLSKRGARHSKSTPNLRIPTGGQSASVPDLSTSNTTSKAQSYEDLLQTAVEQTMGGVEHSNHFSDSDTDDDGLDDDDRSGYAPNKLSVRDRKESPYKEFLVKDRKRKTWANMIRNSSLKKLSTLITPAATHK
ncbi:hypothetical protein BC943DRAFT_85182 [Umbelopsis sp. AD052]|nr:hypothetical protein BC943DRAFT_85182 [Umbelopsis sp. AD052]